MPSPTPATTTGSRTAGYVTAGAVATIPGWFVLGALAGATVATGGVVVLWTTGIAWLLRKRQEDPTWDRRPVPSRVR